MTRRGVVGGPKMSDAHQTYIPSAEKVIRTAKALPSVRKVVLGAIRPVRYGREAIKCWEVPAGLKVKVRGVGDCQILYVFTREPQKVAGDLAALFAG